MADRAGNLAAGQAAGAAAAAATNRAAAGLSAQAELTVLPSPFGGRYAPPPLPMSQAISSPVPGEFTAGQTDIGALAESSPLAGVLQLQSAEYAGGVRTGKSSTAYTRDYGDTGLALNGATSGGALYVMRGWDGTLLRYVFWSATSVDSSGLKYTGPGPLARVVVFTVIGA